MTAPKQLLPGTLLTALALLCCLNLCFAGGARGTSAFQFLGVGVGARAAAMGEAFAGAAGDVGSIYWNPAGLAGIQRGELTMSHALWLEGITYSNIASARPALDGALGVAFNTLNTGSIQKADNNGLRLAQNYNMSDMMGIVSYARGLGRLALGMNLKFISSAIEEESARTCALDIGALYEGYRLWDRPVNAGLVVQNMGTKAKYVAEAYLLPVTVRAGGFMALDKNLMAVLDLAFMEKDVNLRGGAEYTRIVGPLVLAARAGYKSDTVKDLGALSGFTAGLGIKWNDYQLDYAWNSLTDLGITHRLSLGIEFGGAQTKEKSNEDGIISVLSFN